MKIRPTANHSKTPNTGYHIKTSWSLAASIFGSDNLLEFPETKIYSTLLKKTSTRL
jgi:hypothetical protein